MKLAKSVKPLTQVVNSMLEKHGKKVFNMAYLNDNLNNPQIKNPDVGMRWQIWFAIPQDERKLIISESLPFDTWAGGYAPHNDEHLYTLLKKAIPESVYKFN